MTCRLLYISSVLHPQALKSDMIPFLIRLLDLGLEALEGPAATKAQIVKALKAMQTSLKYGEQVGRGSPGSRRSWVAGVTRVVGRRGHAGRGSGLHL